MPFYPSDITLLLRPTPVLKKGLPFMLILSCLILSGCGKKGPLYLPEETQSSPSTTENEAPTTPPSSPTTQETP